MYLNLRQVFFLYPILFFLVLIACKHIPERGPQPLEGFFEKVTTLVTATVRTYLRGDLSKQRLLEENLFIFKKMSNLDEFTSEIKKIDSLKDLGSLIETDILFELQKSEHHKERIEFNSQDFQRQLILSITMGMRRALEQLKERNDANQKGFSFKWWGSQGSLYGRCLKVSDG